MGYLLPTLGVYRYVRPLQTSVDGLFTTNSFGAYCIGVRPLQTSVDGLFTTNSFGFYRYVRPLQTSVDGLFTTNSFRACICVRPLQTSVDRLFTTNSFWACIGVRPLHSSVDGLFTIMACFMQNHAVTSCGSMVIKIAAPPFSENELNMHKTFNNNNK